jgi:hypothetical protein
MSRPITWQNLQQSSFADASRALTQAQGSFTSGLQSVQDIVNKQETTAEANWKQTKDNNTQAFLDEISKYRTAEEFQAAQKAGVFDQLRQQFGVQADRAAIRAAEDGRLPVLQDRTLKANQYADQLQEREARPIVDRLNMMALSEDKDVRRSAKEALGIYAGNGMVPKAAEVAGNIRTAEHQNVAWEQEANKANDELLTNKARRGLLGAQTNQANAAAEHYRSESSSSTATLKAQLSASKAEKAAAELLIKNSPMDAGHMGTHAGQKVFYDELNKMGLDSTQVRDIGNVISTKYANGIVIGKYDHDDPAGKFKKGEDVRVGVPVSTLLAAVRGSNEKERFRNFFGSSSQGDRVASKLEELLATPTHIDSMQEALQAQGIQYRPLSGKGGDVSVSAKTSIRSAIPNPSDDMESGAALVNQAAQARLEKAKSMMTPEEIELAKTGKLPFRIKRFLEEANQR